MPQSRVNARLQRALRLVLSAAWLVGSAAAAQGEGRGSLKSQPRADQDTRHGDPAAAGGGYRPELMPDPAEPKPPARKKTKKHRKKRQPPLPPIVRSDRLELEAGVQAASRLSDGGLVRGLAYAQQRTRLDFTDGALRDGVLSLALAWRASVDAMNPEHPPASTGSAAPLPTATAPKNAQNWARQAQLRQLSLAYSRGWLRTEIGLQEISWGETFGTQVVDVVNPRDYSDPLYTDLNWVRVPVAAINTQIFFGDLTLQAVYTPIPVNNVYPVATSAYSPIKGQNGVLLGAARPLDSTSGNLRSEQGGKLSYLTPFGLDLGLIYYQHWNRNPVYQADAVTTLSPYQAFVKTAGLTASLSFGPFVLRQDVAQHQNQPLQGDQPGQVLPGSTDLQAVTGLDATIFSNWFIGAQYQLEQATYVGGLRKLQWLAAKTQKPLAGDKLNVELFYLRGLDNQDAWLQPTLSWNITGGLTIGVRGDFVAGSKLPSQGYLYTVQGESRYLSSMVYKF